MRLATYNIRAGRGMDDRRSIRRIAEVLREIDPDVICLQEIEKRLPPRVWEDQPRILSDSLGMQMVFQANWKLGPGGYGNAILSRFPIVTYVEFTLPNIRERDSILRVPEKRGLQKVVVETPTGRVAVMNTHWSLDSDDRLEQAAEVAQHVRMSGSPLILAGDFNESDEGEAIRQIRESGLSDAGASAGEPTFTAEVPTERIDYVWHSSDVSRQSVRVVETLASDHRPVAADVEIVIKKLRVIQ